MKKAKSASLWLETGYKLFAEEGFDGVHIERLSRMLGLSKSGFYHYFCDFEGYCIELINLHESRSKLFLEDIRQIKQVDPDYIMVLIKYDVTVMFQVQSIRNPAIRDFHKLGNDIRQKVAIDMRQAWTDYLGMSYDPDLAMRYFAIVRDMIYTRINFKNLNYEFLQTL